MVLADFGRGGDPWVVEAGDGMEDVMKGRSGRGARGGRGVRTPLDRLQSNVRRAWRDFVRQAKAVLAGVGLAWVVWQVVKLISF